MRYKKLTALLLAGTVAASLLLGGCGNAIDSDAVALTCGDTELTLGYMNFVAHYYQASYDSLYIYYYGEDYWTADYYVDADGNTMEDTVKADILTSVETDCLLAQHMDEYGVEITDEERAAMRTAGDQFMEVNGKDAVNAMGATSDYVAEMLWYETVTDRMVEAIEAEVGEDLDIADYARRTFSYIEIDMIGTYDENNEYFTYTAEDLEETEAEANRLAELAQEDFDALADDEGYTIHTYSYGEDEPSTEDGGFHEEVIAQADQMSEGEVSGVIESDGYYFILRLDSEDDPDAAESAMEDASSTIKYEYYSEVLDGYREETPITVDESLWDQIHFTDLFEIDYSDYSE